jgi:hypothetical protein
VKTREIMALRQADFAIADILHVLMIVSVILASIVRRVQAYLLRWRPAQTAAAT